MTEIDLKSRASYTHFTPVHIRFADMDILAHVNNVRQGEYFEAARTAFVYDVLRHAKAWGTVEFVLAKLTIEFHEELHYPGSVEVGSRLTRLGNKSLTTGYGIFKGERCISTSEAINVFIDVETRKTILPPDEVRAMLLKELEVPSLVASTVDQDAAPMPFRGGTS